MTTDATSDTTTGRTDPEPPTRSAPRLRRVLFSFVGGLVALALLTAVPNVLAPWLNVNIEGLSDPTHTRWSLALEGVVDLLVVVCMIVALIRPSRSAVLVQQVLLTALLAAAVIVPFAGPSFLAIAAMLLLFALAYPYPSALLTLRSGPGPSAVLLAMAVASAGVLIPIAVQALSAQATLPRGSGADFNVHATNAEHLLVLALAGLLAATRRPGWTVLAAVVAVTYGFLGVASLVLPNQPNSWGEVGGSASLAWAALFGAATILVARRAGPSPDRQPPLPGQTCP